MITTFFMIPLLASIQQIKIKQNIYCQSINYWNKTATSI